MIGVYHLQYKQNYWVMSYFNLPELFPELTQSSVNPLPLSEFENMLFFSKYHDFISDRQIKGKSKKSKEFFKYIKVKKGTVLYVDDDIAECGFMLLSGCVELLTKKNSRQKLQSFPGHFAHSNNEKINYLKEHFGVPTEKSEHLFKVFFDDNIEFKFMSSTKISSRDEFGFGELLRNTTRTQTAVATENSQLLFIQKSNFDMYLRDFQIRKEKIILNCLTSNYSEQYAEQLSSKLIQIMNSSYVLTFDNEDELFREGDWSTHFYYVLRGEVEIRKNLKLEVPKQFLLNENRGKIEKEVTVKISKIGKGCYLGEAEIMLNKRKRQFTAISVENGSLILKIDHTSFLKVIGQFLEFEKIFLNQIDLKRNYQLKVAEDQFKKIKHSFISQYKGFETKRKEKMLSNFLNDDNEKVDTFEIFASEGVFYRDTFEKLQDFDQHKKDIEKSNYIKRGKVKKSQQSLQLSPSTQPPKRVDEMQKKLFSPKKNANPLDFMTSPIQQTSREEGQDPNANHENSQLNSKQKKSIGESSIRKSMAKSYKSLGKFRQIQKDENVFKKVMIKHGLYPIDRQIDKSRQIKPLIHSNFDEVVKQCISRKNNIIKKIDKSKQNEIIVDTFQRTLTQLKSQSVSNPMKFSRFSTPCRGTEEMKKRMQSIHNPSSRMSEMHRDSSRNAPNYKFDDCIGINSKPTSQQGYKKTRGFTSTHNLRNIPEKMVLLNHMMKPITYYNYNSNDI